MMVNVILLALAVLGLDTLWICAWDIWNTDRNWGKPLTARVK